MRRGVDVADPIQAIELFAREFGGMNCYPSVRAGPNGISATRFFRVNTHDPGQVLTALGLPQMWDAHPSLPATMGLNVPVVQSIDTIKIGGECFVATIGYEPATPGTSNPDDTADDTTAFSEIEPSNDQATIRADAITFDPIPETTIEAARMELKVVVYKPSILGPIAALLPIFNKVNSNPVTFPPLRGFSERLTLGADQVLCRAPSVEPIGRGLAKITIPFGIGPANCWKLRWSREDENGVPTSSSQNNTYERAVFNTGALWT